MSSASPYKRPAPHPEWQEHLLAVLVFLLCTVLIFLGSFAILKDPVIAACLVPVPALVLVLLAPGIVQWLLKGVE